MNPQMLATSPLKLTYAFTASVNPIRASSTDPTVLPNIIDLTVMITNTSVGLFAFEAIKITIPTGADADNLTAGPYNTPDPDPQGLWNYAISGSVVTITPASTTSPATLAGGSNLSFTVPQIKVNEAEGLVSISITEVVSATERNENPPPLFSLTKQAADFPISNFYAQPGVLTALDQQVTLYWDCTPEGQVDFFGLRCDELEWQSPATCFAGGDCYQAGDGTTGVLSPNIPIAGAITFYLDVGATQGSDRIVLESIPTTVQVNVPSISEDSYFTQYLYSGRIVRLHWLATNAANCKIVDQTGTVYATAAPADTYINGYVIVLPDAAGAVTLTVIANAFAPSQLYASQDFPPISTRSPVAFPESGLYMQVGITPDGTKGLFPAFTLQSAAATLIDIPSQTVSLCSPSTTMFVGGIAMTEDPQLALLPGITATGAGAGVVTVIDMASGQLEANTIPVGSPSEAYGIALTNDGKSALVTNTMDKTLTVIDIASRSVISTFAVSKTPGNIALTLDDTKALITNPLDNTVTVIGLPKGVEIATINVGTGPAGIAVSPGGALALVTNLFGNSISVIDLNDMVAAPQTIPVGLTQTLPASPIVVSDTLALVGVDAQGGVTVIDLANMRVVGSMQVGNDPIAFAATADLGLALVVTTSDSDGVTGAATLI